MDGVPTGSPSAGGYNIVQPGQAKKQLGPMICVIDPKEPTDVEELLKLLSSGTVHSILSVTATADRVVYTVLVTTKP